MSVLQSSSPAESAPCLGQALGAQASDWRHSHERCPVAGVAAVAGVTLGDQSLRWAPHCPGMFGAGASLVFLQQITVGGSGRALRSLLPAHPGRPATPGIAQSVVQRSACAAGSIQWWVATCCRPRRACGRSWSRPRIKSWHSVGEDSRLQPHGSGPLPPPLVPPAHGPHSQRFWPLGGVAPCSLPKWLEGVRVLHVGRQAERGEAA